MSGETGKYEAGSHFALRRALELLAPPPLDPETLERYCERLERAGSPQRRLFLAHCGEGAGLQVVSRLIEASWGLRHQAPQRSRKLAEAATQVAEVLELPAEQARLLEDVKAESWALLGNAYRLEESYLSAEEALRKADRHRRAGTADPLLAARLASFRGSLLRDQRCLPEAISHSQKASRLYATAGEVGLEGRELAKLAGMHYTLSDPWQALLATLEAGTRLDFTATPLLAITLVHNSLFYLLDLGLPELSLALLAKAEPLYRLLGEELFLVRARWLRGKLHAALEQWQVAEGFLEHVRQEFLARSLPYDASLAGLDLALVYARQGKHYRVQLLAAQMYEVFLAKGIPREASAALLVFHDAAERNRADVAAIAGVVSRLRELERTGG